MAIVKTNDKHYADIASAIREKNGEETTYNPSEMAEAIKVLESREVVSSLNVYEYTGMFTVMQEDGKMVTGSVSFDSNGIATGLSDDKGTTVHFVNGYPTTVNPAEGASVPIVWG